MKNFNSTISKLKAILKFIEKEDFYEDKEEMIRLIKYEIKAWEKLNRKSKND